MPSPSSAELAAGREADAARLLNASASHSYDPVVDVDWDAPLAPDRYYAPPARLSLYGTPLWHDLAEEQRIELSKHEVASLAGIGVWFEVVLMRMLLRRLYRMDPRTRHAQYALTEIADECRHSVMFGRMIEKFGAPVYRPSWREYQLGRLLSATAGGIQIFAAALIAEEILDALQREAMADATLQPLVRMVSRIHVVEEARHVRYARAELARQVSTAGAVHRGYARLAVGRAACAISRSLISPRVYASVGIDPATGRRAAWANPYHRETLRWAATRVVAYLRELGLVSGPGAALWRRSGLM
jgi:para-aminobenzoate N-oxygenase AurF